MALFVDTSVWSLALRRDAPDARPARTPRSNAAAASPSGAGAAVISRPRMLWSLSTA